MKLFTHSLAYLFIHTLFQTPFRLLPTEYPLCCLSFTPVFRGNVWFLRKFILLPSKKFRRKNACLFVGLFLFQWSRLRKKSCLQKETRLLLFWALIKISNYWLKIFFFNFFTRILLPLPVSNCCLYPPTRTLTHTCTNKLTYMLRKRLTHIW